MQHRHIYVLPGIQNISASFDLIDTIGTAQARFQRKRGYLPRKKPSFGLLDFIADMNPPKLEGGGLQNCKW
jgi:hypothetical protein